MAKENAKTEKDTENTETKSGMSTIKIVIIAVTLSVLLGSGLVGATFYLVSSMNAQTVTATPSAAKKNTDEEDDDAEEADSEPLAAPKYFSMDPKFIVSFSNQKSARFMQFSIEVMSRDAAVVKKIEEHMPVIRSSLLMLFGGQEYEKMATREGKEKLLIETTADINASLQKISGEKEQTAAVEATYFSSFVIQ